MVPALILFALTYLLMLALPQHRPFAALGGALLFVLLGAAGWSVPGSACSGCCGPACAGYLYLWLVWGPAA